MTKFAYIKSNLLIQHRIYFHLVIKMIRKYLNSNQYNLYVKLNELLSRQENNYNDSKKKKENN